MPSAYLIELQIDIIKLEVYTLFRKKDKSRAWSLPDTGHTNESRAMDRPGAGRL